MGSRIEVAVGQSAGGMAQALWGEWVAHVNVTMNKLLREIQWEGM